MDIRNAFWDLNKYITKSCPSWKSSEQRHSADHDIEQILPILVTAIVNFLRSCSNLKFYEYTLTSVRTFFITNLQSTIFKDRIDILLSHYPEWEHELLIMASLIPFSRILWNSLCIHIDWYLNLDSLLAYSSQFFVYPVHSYHSYRP